jgi:phenylalanine ammonia-lyase
MSIDYNDKTLVEVDRVIEKRKDRIILDGKNLSFGDIVLSSKNTSKIRLTKDSKVLQRIQQSYDAMLQNVKDGIPVYGTNSSFGGQAARVHTRGDIGRRVEAAKAISESLVFLDVGVGPKVSPEIVRAAMTIRVNMLMQGVSGVRATALRRFLLLLNRNITPVVNSYGGLGASGDLVHNQRVVSVLRGVQGAKVINEKGRIEEARSALARNNIPLLKLEPKEGLGFVNGDNFSTAYAAIITKKLTEYFLISETVGAMAIEVLKGSDRAFHPLLAQVRPHEGQKESADNYRYLLKGSKLAHQELKGHAIRNNGIKVQDGYSIRCLPQFEGHMIETIKRSLNIITVNANSVSDNPLWVPDDYATPGEEPWQWVSGGNFLAMHMVEVMDSLRKVITQLVKRNDRHLARMIDETENNGLPPNLSSEESIDKCTFKGVQIQSGMLEVYSTVLANPVSTLFGVHEERNQDVTSHAITSGILALKNLELLKYSLAMNLVAVAQGVDLRGGSQLLSSRTRPMYEFVRNYSKFVKKNRPLHEDVEKVAKSLDSGEAMAVVREQIFAKM